MSFRSFCFALMFVISSSVFAQGLTVHIPPENESNVKDLMKRLEYSINNEDFNEYVSCFTKDLSSKNKKKIAAMFLQYDMGMEFEDFSITDSNEDTIEFTAKYVVYFGQNSNVVISSVVAKKVEDNFVISSEEIVSKYSANSNNVNINNDFVFDPNPVNNRLDCPDGNCPLVQNNPIDQNNNNNKTWVSIFNDSKGKPNLNGPMWIDPMEMVRMFPDKYPPSCGGKCEKVNPKLRAW